MSDNLVVESPDFDRIRKEAGYATEDAARLLWFVLNDEIKLRRQTVRDAKETDEGKVLYSSATTAQNDFDTVRAQAVVFTGASAFNLTGFSNGIDGRRIVIHVLGSGTVTLKHNTTSATGNRFSLITGTDTPLVQGASATVEYISGAWRQL